MPSSRQRARLVEALASQSAMLRALPSEALDEALAWLAVEASCEDVQSAISRLQVALVLAAETKKAR